MKYAFVVAGALALSAAAAIAAPAEQEIAPAPTVETAVPIDGLLLNLGYSIEQHADGTLKISTIAGDTERQSVPPQLDAPCKGYQPPVGCTINYNDGYMCNMWCGGILTICHCVI